MLLKIDDFTELAAVRTALGITIPPEMWTGMQMHPGECGVGAH